MRRLPHLVVLSFSISGTILFIRVHFITINLKLLASRWFEKFHIRTPEKTGILTSLCGKVCLLVSDWWLVKGCLLTRYSTIFSISTFIFSLYLEIECCDQFHSYVESITSIGRPWDECSLRTTPALYHPRYPQTNSFSTHKKWNICADRPCDILPKGEKCFMEKQNQTHSDELKSNVPPVDHVMTWVSLLLQRYAAAVSSLFSMTGTNSFQCKWNNAFVNKKNDEKRKGVDRSRDRISRPWDDLHRGQDTECSQSRKKSPSNTDTPR